MRTAARKWIRMVGAGVCSTYVRIRISAPVLELLKKGACRFHGASLSRVFDIKI